MSRNKISRTSLVVCLAGGLALSGCAGGGWNRWVGKKDRPSANLTLAWSKLKEEEGRLTDARSGYEKVLAEEPNNVDAMLGMARMNVKAQRLVDAEDGYAQALKLQPQSPIVLSEVGQFYAQLQRWDKSIPLLQEAQRIEPHEKTHHYMLAVVLTKAGRAPEAIPHFTEAVGEAAAHYNVGRILIEGGKTQEAEEQFQLALAKDPALSDADYFLTEIRAGRNSFEGSNTLPSTTKPTTQQVSAEGTSRPLQVTPVATGTAAGQPSGRSPSPPHVGYEELPPPSDFPHEASYKQSPSNPSTLKGVPGDVLQTSGFTTIMATTPAGSTLPKLLPAELGSNGAHVRLSTTQQIPLGN